MKNRTISRRQFITGTGMLVVSFSMAPSLSRIFAQGAAPAGLEPEASSLDSWLAVAADGNVTMYTSKVDLGTGVVTALSQIVAEELDVPFRAIHMETGDTSQTIDQAATVGSATIARGGPQLRQAAAAARQELMKLASARLQAPVQQLSVSDGIVTAGGSGKKISYGELIGGKRFDVRITATGAGRTLQVAPEVPAKDPKTYKIVGTSVPRVDLPPKFTGEFTYTADVRVPGMLHGRVVRPATFGTRPVSVDEGSIKDIPGVVKVVHEGSFLGVVAQTEWSAIQAARKLKVTWSAPERPFPTTTEAVFEYLKNTKSSRDQSVLARGNTDAAISQSAKPFEATYRWPFQLHGMLGPSSAVADVRQGAATIWAGSQGTFGTRSQVASLLKLPEKSVRVIYREGSGCYGRLSPDDAPLDAALMSRAVGKPVRVQWMRDDEHGWEPKGPAQLLTVRAATDVAGKVTAWDFVDRSFPWTENGNPLLASRQTGIQPTSAGLGNGTGGGGQIYRFDSQKVVASSIPWMWPEPMPLRTSNLRAPGDLARCFASESAIDEIAAALHVDPVEFRLRYLDDDRIVHVLNEAAKKAKWQTRPSPAPSAAGNIAVGRGVAVANRDQTLIAAIAEVEVNRTSGKVAVKRVTLAQDCGLIVNPDGITNQIEGNVIQGVSRTLLEEVKFDASGIKSLDWESYPIVHFPEIPEIDVVLVNRTDLPPSGGGEPSLVPVPAAIANAVFDAVGVRLREVPMTPERVLAALKDGVSSSELRPVG
jgi:nicotinate dehydrogenase subunit B